MFAHYSQPCREHKILAVSINLTSYFKLLSIFLKQSAFLFLIHEVSGSNLYPDFGYPDRVWVFVVFFNGKGKAVPLQARRRPEGSRKLRFPDFVTTAPDSGRL
jgi:hypothetical protein